MIKNSKKDIDELYPELLSPDLDPTGIYSEIEEYKITVLLYESFSQTKQKSKELLKGKQKKINRKICRKNILRRRLRTKLYFYDCGYDSEPFVVISRKAVEFVKGKIGLRKFEFLNFSHLKNLLKYTWEVSSMILIYGCCQRRWDKLF